MKTTNLYSFLMFGVMLLGAIIGCSKDSDENYPEPNANPIEPDMVFVQGNASKSIGSFSIGKFEVTQAQWMVVMKTTVQQIADSLDRPLAGVGNNYPMYYVSWDDVQEYIAKLNAITGMNYRLPTSAEWKYAASGGAISK